ncbi:class I SAM-dependent methyltransferase [Amphibacillus sp. MSJ-3]|uniref:class I SAM-dependent DNA methyltransferase n=1 Tax=Amphibacillus sp. MSJ-3 TaxID=2841505 RepID=UPI001C0F2554|nr:class I SAM-dependent methyltransferase [Amphibacillus sp. MSJ-3]
MTYQKLAKLYDFLMEDAPYDQWVKFTELYIKKDVPAKQIKILDLGCGTGQVTCRLAEKGYQLTGVDLSEDMLVEAASHAMKDNLNIQWIKQDITQLEGLNHYDLIVSYCDVVNYITDQDKLSATFHHAYQSLSDDGVFLFDVHNMDYVENEMVDQLFSEVYDHLAYIWFCYPGKYAGEMKHELTFFIEEDGKYQRFDEFHHQRTYPLSIYLKLLTEAGFKDVELYTDFQTTPIDDLTVEPLGERLFFACRK